jgi:hypothetical protein
MKIGDIMPLARDVVFVMIHEDVGDTLGGGSMSCFADELSEKELSEEVKWFEANTLNGKPCLEFTV